MIKAEIVAHSLSPQGDELISVLCTFPRIILAEVNTHRMLSKNTSSSRAIPFQKMVKAIIDNPFIPIAFQKHHSGMQGNEYLDLNKKYTFEEIQKSLHETLKKGFYNEEEDEWDENFLPIDEVMNKYVNPILSTSKDGLTCSEWWLKTRDLVIGAAFILYSFGVTKQLCNRLLEPFMWTTMLITGSRQGWDNLFHLRCPQYSDETGEVFKSKEDFINNSLDPTQAWMFDFNGMEWFNINEGQAEIHMMALAESIYDAVNESTPKQLKAGEWHIPFENKISSNVTDWSDDIKVQAELWGKDLTMYKVKVSTAMSARTSYTVVGEEKNINYQKMIDLHDRLISQNPPHSSPLEHCARTMSHEEYYLFNKGKGYTSGWDKSPDELHFTSSQRGWCNNFKGFIPYRYLIDNKLKI